MFKFVVPLAFCLTLASPAVAGSPDQPRSVRVSYADLDLTSAQGRNALHQRLAKATRTVCQAPGRRSFAEMMAERACMRQTRAKTQIAARLAATKEQLRLALNEARATAR